MKLVYLLFQHFFPPMLICAVCNISLCVLLCTFSVRINGCKCITLQWKKLIARLDLLSAALRKLDLWDDPAYASRISREHGELLNKTKM